jgi:biopolymer transport protein ExbD
MGVLFDVQRDLQKRDLLKVNYNSDLPDAMPLMLPSKQLEEKATSIPDEDIAVVNARGNGEIIFNKTKVSSKDLPAEVKKSVGQNDHLVVSIQMDLDATYEDYVTVLDAVKKEGHCHDNNVCGQLSGDDR